MREEIYFRLECVSRVVKTVLPLRYLVSASSRCVVSLRAALRRALAGDHEVGQRAPPVPARRSGCSAPPATRSRPPPAAGDAPRSDALQVRDGQSARAERRFTPPHPPDIKPTILCGTNLMLCRVSRDMDLDVREKHI